MPYPLGCFVAGEQYGAAAAWAFVPRGVSDAVGCGSPVMPAVPWGCRRVGWLWGGRGQRGSEGVRLPGQGRRVCGVVGG